MILLLSALLMFTPASVWTQCTASSNLKQFSVDLNPVEYDSGRRRDVGETGLPSTVCSGMNPVICLASSTPIGNDIREPASLTDLSSTFAWNEDVTITVGVNPVTRVRAINLFFYNIPSMGIGLPQEIELNWGTSQIQANNRLGHAVLGNSDLSQEDNTTRNVTIGAIADDSGDETNYASISITFHFSEADPIRWVILSEVEICDQVTYTPRQDSIPLTIGGNEMIRLEPNNIQSQINFTCTVEIEGSFQWVWSGPSVDMSLSQQDFANTNRTSSITLTQLSTDSAGTYDCTATYDPRSLPMGVTTSAMGLRIFTVQIESAVFTALNDTLVVAMMNSSVTLSCEIHGYLPRGYQPQITWRRMNGEAISSSSPPYMLSTSDGSNQIQNGGTSPQPSYVSSLTIDVMDRSVEDTYICSEPSFMPRSIQLNVGGGSPPTNSTQTGSPQSDGTPVLWAIIGGILGALVLISVVVAVTVIVVIMCVKCHHNLDGERTYDLPADYEKPIAPPAGIIPPRMEMNVAYEQVKSIDMSANSAYTTVITRS